MNHSYAPRRHQQLTLMHMLKKRPDNNNKKEEEEAEEEKDTFPTNPCLNKADHIPSKERRAHKTSRLVGDSMDGHHQSDQNLLGTPSPRTTLLLLLSRTRTCSLSLLHESKPPKRPKSLHTLAASRASARQRRQLRGRGPQRHPSPHDTTRPICLHHQRAHTHPRRTQLLSLTTETSRGPS